MSKKALSLWALPLCCLLAACGSKSGLLSGAAAGGASGAGGIGAAGGTGGTGGQTRCRGAVKVSGAKELIDDNGVSRHQLLAVGSGWAALVTVNISGQYEALLYFIDESGLPQGEGINLTEDFEPSVDGAFMALDGGGLMVAWTGDEFDTGKDHLLIRLVTLSGAVGPAVEIETGVKALVPTFYPSPAGLDFVLHYFAIDRPQAARVSRQGALLAGPEPLFPPYTGPGFHYGYRWLWPDRVLQNTGPPSGPQWLSLGEFTYGTPPVSPTGLFQASGSLHIASSIDGPRPLVGLYDTDLGATLVTIQPDSVTQRYQISVEQGKRPKVAQWADCGYAMLVDRGKWKSTNPLSTHVDLHLLDSNFELVVDPVQVNTKIAGSCLEHDDIAVTQDGSVGVLWTEGCVGSRHVRFSKITVGP